MFEELAAFEMNIWGYSAMMYPLLRSMYAFVLDDVPNSVL